MAGTAGTNRQEQHNEQDSELGQPMYNSHFSTITSVIYELILVHCKGLNNSRLNAQNRVNRENETSKTTAGGFIGL